MDTAVTDHLLTTTRAVRRRLDLDRPVPRSVVLDCLRIATQAPTAANTQNWRWLVVTDPEKRARLADLYREIDEANGSHLRRTAETHPDPQTVRVFTSAVYLAEVMHRVPVHVIPCLQGRIDDVSGIGRNAIAAAFYGSIFQAVWSFQLALRSRGLGSCFTTLHLVREAEAAKILGIPDDVTQAALIPVAYTTGGDFTPVKRRPVEEITHWDQWGGTGG